MSPWLSIPDSPMMAHSNQATEPVKHGGLHSVTTPPKPLHSAARVLIYTTCYNFIDGVTLTIRKLEQAIVKSGGSVCVLTTRSGSESNTNINGLGDHPNRRVIFLEKTIRMPEVLQGMGDSYFQIALSISKEAMNQIDDFEPTLVHITVPDPVGLCAVEYARERQIPLMGTYHSNIPDYLDFYPGTSWIKPIVSYLFRHSYNFYQTLYVPTPYIRDNLIKKQKLDKITKVQIWGRGIDLEKFSPSHRSEKFRIKLGIKPEDVVILYVGRLVAEKRLDVFVNVIKRLSQANIPFRALVAGNGLMRDEISKLPNTTCLGWVNSDDLPVLYSSSDLFLFPSGVETFGNVTLEAAASGLPLVAESACSGHLVEEDVNGYACENGNVDSFYNATLRLVADGRKRKEFSRASRRLSASYEKETVLNQMVANYSDVTEEFFAVYGGDHSNRDIAFDNEDSFVGGSIPRPFLWHSVEYFVVILLKLIFSCVSFCRWLQDVYQVSGLLASQDRVSMQQFVQSNSTDLELHAIIEPPQPLFHGSLTSEDVERLNNIDLTKSRDAVEPRHDDLDDLRVSHSPINDSADDITQNSTSIGSLFAAIGDSRFAGSLSDGFCRAVLFSWSLECRMRLLLKRNLFRFSTPLIRQRKNSGYELSFPEMGQQPGPGAEITTNTELHDQLGRRIRPAHFQA